MFWAEAVMPTVHSQDFAGYYYQRRLLGRLWMPVSGTYTHDRTKDVLIQCRIHMVLEPPIASKHIPRSNMAAK